jgi:hypothetical protein
MCTICAVCSHYQPVIPNAAHFIPTKIAGKAGKGEADGSEAAENAGAPWTSNSTTL